MDPLKIIAKYYEKDSEAYHILVVHSTMVMKKALAVAKKYQKNNPSVEIDMQLIEEAAMLHDIGCYLTCSKSLGAVGGKPYICHGTLGREILEREGLKKHALICERHVGVGITKKEIIQKKFPLPQREMVPITIEEEIVSYADNFFSKRKETLRKEKSIDEIRKAFAPLGENKVKLFNKMAVKFGDM
jgi:uncharacterized protein